jgi:hypothetical protein
MSANNILRQGDRIAVNGDYVPAAISASATATLSCEWILMYCISTDLWS